MMRRLRFLRGSLTASTPTLAVSSPPPPRRSPAGSRRRARHVPPRAAARLASSPSSSVRAPAARGKAPAARGVRGARAPPPATPPRYLWLLYLFARRAGRPVDLRVTLLLCVSVYHPYTQGSHPEPLKA
jgi:hypothetical protein